MNVGFPSAELFDNRPVIIAGIACLFEKFDPCGRVIVKLGGEHPTLENLFLLRRVVAVDLYERTASGSALNLLHHLDSPRAREIIDGVEAQHAIEAVVRKRQLLGGAQ